MQKHKIAWLLGSFGIVMVLTVLLMYPVYPDFQKDAASMDKLKSSLQEQKHILYPDLDALQFTQLEYRISLSKRTLISQPEGYVIEGTIEHSGTSILYILSAQTAGTRRMQGDITYHDVALHATQADTEAVHTITVEFAKTGWLYTVTGMVPQGEHTAETAEQLIDSTYKTLLRVCYQMIDQ